MIPFNSKVYLSGPMSGLPNFNYNTFHAVAAELRNAGYKVVSPAENVDDPSADWSDFMRRDIALMLQTDIIVALPGWEKSRGASIEIALGVKLGMNVFEYPDLQEIDIEPIITAKKPLHKSTVYTW